MDTETFRVKGKEMIDFICNYLENIEKHPVIPDVSPGYLRESIPANPPTYGEDWNTIMKDVDKHIIPGLTHWQHPNFYAYFPAGNSYPAILGDMLSSALGCVGFSWAACPAITELEVIMLDWFATMMDIPKKFLHTNEGGGAMQGSASDAIFISMLAARFEMVRKLKKENKEVDLGKFVAYSSKIAHSCVEKNAMLTFVTLRKLEINCNYATTGDVLREAIEEDLAKGLVPFYMCATLGTTDCCSFDDLSSIGPVAKEYDLWLHADGAYGLSSRVCEDLRNLTEGLEHTTSINFNPNKWLLVTFDCSVLWVEKKEWLRQAMNVNPVYLQHNYKRGDDLRHWGIPLSRRFRALKLWFVMRSYGVEGLQKYIHDHVNLAKEFEKLVRQDPRFEIVGKVDLGLACFKIKGSANKNKCLHALINESRKVHMTLSQIDSEILIRFAVCRESAKMEDVNFAWSVVKEYADVVNEAEESIRNWHLNIVCKRKEETCNADTPLAATVEADAAPANEMDGDEVIPPSDLEDEDILELAQARLIDLKEQGAQEAYDLLAQQLRSMGVHDIMTFDECQTQQPAQDDSVFTTDTLLEDSLMAQEDEADVTDLSIKTPFIGRQAISSTPYSKRGPIPNLSQVARRLSLNTSLSTNKAPAVARLVSMVADSHDRSLFLEDLENSAAFPSFSTANQHAEEPYVEVPVKEPLPNATAPEDLLDVFKYDKGYDFANCTETTLTRLRKCTLLKMISDPTMYNKRRFVSTRKHQRRMTTVFDETADLYKQKEEFRRRPTLQVCENLDRGSIERYDEVFRRNKSMFEPSNPPILFDSIDASHDVSNSQSEQINSVAVRRENWALKEEDRIEEEEDNNNSNGHS